MDDGKLKLLNFLVGRMVLFPNCELGHLNPRAKLLLGRVSQLPLSADFSLFPPILSKPPTGCSQGATGGGGTVRITGNIARLSLRRGELRLFLKETQWHFSPERMTESWSRHLHCWECELNAGGQGGVTQGHCSVEVNLKALLICSDTWSAGCQPPEQSLPRHNPAGNTGQILCLPSDTNCPHGHRCGL